MSYMLRTRLIYAARLLGWALTCLLAGLIYAAAVFGCMLIAPSVVVLAIVALGFYAAAKTIDRPKP